jgi:hypothetical protein
MSGSRPTADIRLHIATAYMSTPRIGRFWPHAAAGLVNCHPADGDSMQTPAFALFLARVSPPRGLVCE